MLQHFSNKGGSNFLAKFPWARPFKKKLRQKLCWSWRCIAREPPEALTTEPTHNMYILPLPSLQFRSTLSSRVQTWVLFNCYQTPKKHLAIFVGQLRCSLETASAVKRPREQTARSVTSNVKNPESQKVAKLQMIRCWMAPQKQALVSWKIKMWLEMSIVNRRLHHTRNDCEKSHSPRDDCCVDAHCLISTDSTTTFH